MPAGALPGAGCRRLIRRRRPADRIAAAIQAACRVRSNAHGIRATQQLLEAVWHSWSTDATAPLAPCSHRFDQSFHSYLRVLCHQRAWCRAGTLAATSIKCRPSQVGAQQAAGRSRGSTPSHGARHTAQHRSSQQARGLKTWVVRPPAGLPAQAPRAVLKPATRVAMMHPMYDRLEMAAPVDGWRWQRGHQRRWLGVPQQPVRAALPLAARMDEPHPCCYVPDTYCNRLLKRNRDARPQEDAPCSEHARACTHPHTWDPLPGVPLAVAQGKHDAPDRPHGAEGRGRDRVAQALEKASRGGPWQGRAGMLGPRNK